MAISPLRLSVRVWCWKKLVFSADQVGNWCSVTQVRRSCSMMTKLLLVGARHRDMTAINGSITLFLTVLVQHEPLPAAQIDSAVAGSITAALVSGCRVQRRPDTYFKLTWFY